MRGKTAWVPPRREEREDEGAACVAPGRTGCGRDPVGSHVGWKILREEHAAGVSAAEGRRGGGTGRHTVSMSWTKPRFVSQQRRLRPRQDDLQSEAFIFGSPGQPNYAATKAGREARPPCNQSIPQRKSRLTSTCISTTLPMHCAHHRPKSSGILWRRGGHFDYTVQAMKAKAKAREPSGPSPFERFNALAKRLVAVPKSELDKREAAYRRQRAGKKAKAR